MAAARGQTPGRGATCVGPRLGDRDLGHPLRVSVRQRYFTVDHVRRGVDQVPRCQQLTVRIPPLLYLPRPDMRPFDVSKGPPQLPGDRATVGSRTGPPSHPSHHAMAGRIAERQLVRPLGGRGAVERPEVHPHACRVWRVYPSVHLLGSHLEPEGVRSGGRAGNASRTHSRMVMVSGFLERTGGPRVTV